MRVANKYKAKAYELFSQSKGLEKTMFNSHTTFHNIVRLNVNLLRLLMKCFYCSQVSAISRSPQQTTDDFEDQCEHIWFKYLV